MLYGCFMQFRRFATARSANAKPRRIPARPNALERVWRTMRFGYLVTAVLREELGGEKSMYASSRTRRPFQNGRVSARRAWIESGEISFPVGLPGDVNMSNFIVGSAFNVDTIWLIISRGGYLVNIYLPIWR